jgi:hypothetical protein
MTGGCYCRAAPRCRIQVWSPAELLTSINMPGNLAISGSKIPSHPSAAVLLPLPCPFCWVYNGRQSLDIIGGCLSKICPKGQRFTENRGIVFRSQTLLRLSLWSEWQCLVLLKFVISVSSHAKCLQGGFFTFIHDPLFVDLKKGSHGSEVKPSQIRCHWWNESYVDMARWELKNQAKKKTWRTVFGFPSLSQTHFKTYRS